MRVVEKCIALAAAKDICRASRCISCVASLGFKLQRRVGFGCASRGGSFTSGARLVPWPEWGSDCRDGFWTWSASTSVSVSDTSDGGLRVIPLWCLRVMASVVCKMK